MIDDLQAQGIRCGKNRIAPLMRNHRIAATAKKKFKATTNSRHNLPVAENLLNQDFTTDGPNEVWASDTA